MTDIVTVDEYKTYYNLKKPDDDPKIQMVATAVSSLIKAYIGSSLTDNYTDPLVETIYLDYDTNAIYLDQYPVNEVLDVAILGGSGLYPYDSTVHWPYVVGNDFTVSDGVVYRTSGYWPQSPYGVQITYTSGYAETPEGVELAAIQLMNYYLSEGYKQTRTIDSSTIINSVNKDPNFPPYIRAILDTYKS